MKSLDAYATANLVVVLLLPFVTSERVLVEVLTGLSSSSSRWRLRRGTYTADAVHVAVEWTTSEKLVDDTMGFAPHIAIATY
jgi:hypothetical protein